MSKLIFFPVTTKKYNKLEDLNGQSIMLHSRGGGTDSIANVIKAKIKFGRYVSGSELQLLLLVKLKQLSLIYLTKID